MILSKKDACSLIDVHYHSALGDINELKTIYSLELLTSERLDLAFKLLYLDNVEKSIEYALDVYKEHLKAFSLGSFKERGNDRKDSFEAFVSEFEDIYNSMLQFGFCSDISLVPISRNNQAINGSHRISSAIKLKKHIQAISLNLDAPSYNYKFFRDRGVPINYIEDAVLKFIEYSENTYIAFIWPSANGHYDLVAESFENIIYQKEIKLNFNGAHNLLSELYSGEEWLGSCNDNYSGVIGKQIECFSHYGPVRVIFFQADSIESVLSIKDKVRNIFNIGKHSIHITDTKKEAIDISRLILNKNGLHFLMHASPTKYCSIYERLSEFLEVLNLHEIDLEDVVIDSGSVLSLYGIRESNDIDYLTAGTTNFDCNGKFESHEDDLKYHKLSKYSLLYNPEYNFIFKGFKFVSLEQVYRLKLNRAGVKDINDVSLIKLVLNSKKIDLYRDIVWQYFSYFKIKFRIKIIELLKSLNMFDFFYSVYKKIKGN